jgi:hypothetical protein
LDLLIDSCSYFRLARILHPLLGKPLGPLQYTLFMHPQFNLEYNQNPRLPDKFKWVNEPDFINNRNSYCINILTTRQKEIMRVFASINAFKRESRSSISDVDIYALSTAFVQDIILITDDIDMLSTAVFFEINYLKTLDYLNYLYSNGIITDAILLAIFEQWKIEKDFPAYYRLDRKKYFPHLITH